MNVRATVERLGREHVGKSWWADLAEALVREFEPVVAERDELDSIVSAYHDATGCLPEDASALRAELEKAEAERHQLRIQVNLARLFLRDISRNRVDDPGAHAAEALRLGELRLSGTVVGARAALDRETP